MPGIGPELEQANVQRGEQICGRGEGTGGILPVGQAWNEKGDYEQITPGGTDVASGGAPDRHEEHK